MSVRRSMGLLGGFLFAATAAVTFSQGARAESGFLWLDSAYAVPAGQMRYHPRWNRVSRPKAVGVSATSYVAPPSRPRVVEVASAAPVRNDCFWCNVRISGLSF
jgi:hypothetical protein